MGLIGKLLKTTIDIATLPVSVIADTITMGGELIDRDESYWKFLIGIKIILNLF